MHKHTASQSTDSAYRAPLGLPSNQNPSAHGGICRHEICKCGAYRFVNINGNHREPGAWHVASQN